MDKTYRLERDCRKAVMGYLRKLPHGKFVKVHQGPYSETGISDILGCYKGRFVAIETKSEHGKPTRKQLNFILDVIDAGGFGGVVKTINNARSLIESIDNS